MTSVPARRATSCLRGSVAGTSPLPISARPRNSIAVAIVLAVNCPPHAPAPGQARSSSSHSAASVMRARRVRADRFVDVLDRHVTSLEPSRRDRTAVEDQRRQIEARQDHRGGGDRLVAADQHDQRVEEVAARDQLDRIGDHFAAHQRGAHPRGSHRDPVGDRDGVELHRRAARGAHAVLERRRQLPQVQVARADLGPGIRDAHDGARQRVAVEARRPQHRTGPRPARPVRDRAALPFPGAFDIGHLDIIVRRPQFVSPLPVVSPGIPPRPGSGFGPPPLGRRAGPR